jgi:hypothetical protein
VRDKDDDNLNEVEGKLKQSDPSIRIRNGTSDTMANPFRLKTDDLIIPFVRRIEVGNYEAAVNELHRLAGSIRSRTRTNVYQTRARP